MLVISHVYYLFRTVVLNDVIFFGNLNFTKEYRILNLESLSVWCLQAVVGGGKGACVVPIAIWCDIWKRMQFLKSSFIFKRKSEL